MGLRLTRPDTSGQMLTVTMVWLRPRDSLLHSGKGFTDAHHGQKGGARFFFPALEGSRFSGGVYSQTGSGNGPSPSGS